MNLSACFSSLSCRPHTVSVVAITRNRDYLGAYLSTLLRNVVLADVLSRNKSGQSSDNGELLEEHCGWQVLDRWEIWIGA